MLVFVTLDGKYDKEKILLLGYRRRNILYFEKEKHYLVPSLDGFYHLPAEILIME